MFLNIGDPLALLESKDQASHPHPALQIFYLLSPYFLASVRTNGGTAGAWRAEPAAKLLLLSSSVILETARDGVEVV